MENASKALIIAGSVILAVLIIVLGFYFFNQASGIGKSINMTEYEILSYNSKFINYEGKASGTKARELCDVIIQHNSANLNNKGKGVYTFYNNSSSSTHFLSLVADEGMVTQARTVKGQLKTGKFYDIKLMYDENVGVVTAVNFVEL